MHIYLIGYRGSGKTTVGRLLGQRLGLETVDADDLIEQQARKTIREIFEVEGAEGFRDRESRVVSELAQKAAVQARVVSLGGGAILRESNRELICASGYRVWLVASPEKLLARIQGDQTTAARRPALSGLNEYDEIVAILNAREPLYRSVAQKIVDTETLSVEAICDEIVSWLSNFPR